MQFLKLLKKYVVDTEFFVSLCGTLFAIFFMLEQEILRWPTVFLIFITFWSGYLYTKFQYSKHLQKILIFNVLTGVISSILIYLNHNEIRLIKWLFIVVLGLLYNSFFLEKFVRKIPLLKIFYVGLIWALINSWLILPEIHWPVFFISWFFITALVLPFDIRDMNDDNVVTFPRIIGVQKTKYLAYFLVFISNISAIYFLKMQYAAAFTLTSVITFLLIYFSETSNKNTYFSVWIELCSALPFFFLILLKYF